MVFIEGFPQFNVDHQNNAVTEDIFRQDTAKADSKAVEIIRQMLDGNVKVANIKKALSVKGIHLSSNQIRYQIKQIVGAPMDEEKLEGFLKIVKEEGGDVNILRFPDGKVRVLSISRREMKRGYVDAKPTVIQVDTTYGLEQCGYKLNAVLYKNGTTGKGEICVLSFMADETAESYTFALSSFEYLRRFNPPVIIIDKDFTEWAVLKNLFPNSVILLCTFHVLKWWKTMIATALVPQVTKRSIAPV